jgi:hypothetical protein
MKHTAILLGGACVLALSACSDLGFDDLELSDAPEAQTLEPLEDDTEVAESTEAAPGTLPVAAFGPADAKPGECYAKLTVPAQYRTIS